MTAKQTRASTIYCFNTDVQMPRNAKTGMVGLFVATFEEKQHTIHYKAVVSSKISLPSSVDKIISNPISNYRL